MKGILLKKVVFIFISFFFKEVFGTNIVMQDLFHNYQYTESVPNLSSVHILQLYQMMKDTHEIFMIKNLEYWIIAGTLLGAIRHRGQIPWDEDIDIAMSLHQEKYFLSLVPIFHQYGYEVVKFGLGHKIQPINGKLLKQGSIYKAPWIDVFYTIKKGNKIFFDPKRDIWPVKRDGQPIHFYHKELYPLQTYIFGEMLILGPNDPYPYLHHCYGDDWNNYAYKWNHFTDLKEKIKLTDQDKMPAQPTGPLK